MSDFLSPQLCGGGPSLSLWHLRSLSPTSIFNLSGCQRQAAFHQDLVSKTLQSAFVHPCWCSLWFTSCDAFAVDPNGG